MIPRTLVLASVTALLLSRLVGSTAVSGGEPEVTIQTFRFRPSPLEITAGTRVTWTNTDDITHTVTSGTPERRDAQFDAPLRDKGASFGFTFATAGTYRYFCDRHPSMRGEIRVR
jgi:plastocyanin